MDYEVILSPRAIQDLHEIVRYIAWDSPNDAEQFGNKLLDRAQSLSSLPERGRVVPEFKDPQIRELILKVLQDRLSRETGGKGSGNLAILARGARYDWESFLIQLTIFSSCSFDPLWYPLRDEFASERQMGFDHGSFERLRRRRRDGFRC